MINYKAENHKDQLMQYLVGDSLSHFPSLKDLDDYIDLFSFFIYNIDPDYLYNLPFLPEQHNKFQHFLKIAPQKCATLTDIATKLSEEPTIKRLIIDPAYHNCPVTLSINDFLAVNLRNLDKLTFHDHFSITGATCSHNADQFTFKIDNFIFSWDSHEKNYIEAIGKISQLIQTFIYKEEE